MAQSRTGRRSGFTLVEMLVVIAIIAILAGILIPVGAGAIRSSRKAANGLEIADITQAIEKYRSENGGLYPPSFGEGGSANPTYYQTQYGMNGTGPWRNTLLGRYVMKAYPKCAATDIQYLFTQADSLDQSSALVFWLSQTSADKRYPFTNATKRNYYGFDETRVSAAGYRPRHAGESLYIYIEARHYPLHTSGGLTTAGDLANAQTSRPAGSGATPIAEASVRPFIRQVPAAQQSNALRHNCTVLANYVNPDTFQLHCAGLDGRFTVDNSLLRVFPCGPSGLRFDGQQHDPVVFADDRDNQTNFTDGQTVEDVPAQ